MTALVGLGCWAMACTTGEIGGSRGDSREVDWDAIVVDGSAAGDAPAVLHDGSSTSNPEAGGDLALPCALICGGCCLADQCLPGVADAACGKGGSACQDCSQNGQTCAGGACVGVCTPSCAGKCAGQDDGCGTPCAANACTGCCDGSGVCQKGTSASACGTGGESCASCPAVTPTCSAGDCVCTPSCAGKCAGQDDGCGTPCAANACTGCCDGSGVCQKGTSASVCGLGGEPCADCTLVGQVCSTGVCKCLPACAGKCAGTDDGCGGTCPTNHCIGCCDSSLTCQGGKSDVACGNNGAACVDCSASGTTCKPGNGGCI